MSSPKVRPIQEIVTLETETTLHVAEHERLLSFNGDDDAEWFDDWWYERGSKLFAAYVNKRSRERD